MGRVLVQAKVQNIYDLWDVKQGTKTPDQVRTVVVPDALVDSGASTLGLPANLIRDLGLVKLRERNVRSATGVGRMGYYDVVALDVQGRDCRVQVMELPEGSPVLIGQVPLQEMDWVIDMKGERLIGNPAHNGEWVTDMFGFWE